jgi:hypothetical protein
MVILSLVYINAKTPINCGVGDVSHHGHYLTGHYLQIWIKFQVVSALLPPDGREVQVVSFSSCLATSALLPRHS